MSLGQTYLWVLEGLLRRWGSAVAYCQGKDTGGRGPYGIFFGVSSPGGRHFGTETWPHPTACRIQCWDASGQTTNRVGTQPQPSTDRLPKVVLSSHPPLDTPLDMALPIRGTRSSSTHKWADTSRSHEETCTSPWTNLTHQGADTRSKKNYSPAAQGTEPTNTES